MPTWAVRGSYLARRDYWQRFTKVREAPDAEAAKELALSEIGSTHHVARRWIRLEKVEPAKDAP
jgi:ribosomal protein L20A (L18A)